MKKSNNERKASLGTRAIASVRRWFSEHNIIYALIVLIVIASISSDKFLTVTNILNVLRQTSMVAIVAVGAFFILLGGGLDLSTGSLVGLSGILFAKMMAEAGINTVLSIILTIIFSAAVGAFNGTLVAYLKIPAFIVTLGIMETARGLCYIITNAYPVIGLPSSIAWIGRGYFLSIPVPIIIMLAMFIIASFISQKTKFGRYVYAVGSNPDASRLSGINTRQVIFTTYVIGGIMAGIASIILVSRIESGQPNAGQGWEFNAITATVIGGTSISGGVGNAFGVLLGALVVAVLTNMMTLLNVGSYYQQVVRGAVLVLAIGIDVFKTARENKA